MRQYLIKRLLWMFFTVFGIMVITFCVTRLAPGDPALLKLQSMGQSAVKNQQLSRQLIEDTRKLYGFDMPLVLNFRNDNPQRTARTLIDDLNSPDEYKSKSAYDKLISLGKITIPYINDVLSGSKKNINYEILLNCASDISGLKFAIDQTLEAKISDWNKFYAENADMFNIEAHKKLLMDLISGNPELSKVAEGKLLLSGTSALPVIMGYALSADIDKAGRLINIASKITKKGWFADEALSVSEKKEVIYKWKKWWLREKTNYAFPDTIEKITNIFTKTQFARWMGMVITLNFGESYSYHAPVMDLIKERLPVSLQLNLISIFITYIIAVPLGVFSATHQYKMSDKIITVILFILYSLPSFWVANMLILFTTGGDFPMIFPSRYLHSVGSENYSWFKWVLDWLWHLVLPVTCLTYGSFAYVSRQMRVGMLDIIRYDFIRTARAKGLSEHAVIFRHALRNALIPTVTLLAYLLPALLGGSVIIEEIFTIEGMGKLSFEAIINRDYPIINAIAFFSAVLTLMGMLFTDIAYIFVDPRISFEK